MNVPVVGSNNEEFEAEQLFHNLNGELSLKNCTTEKHTFKIRNQSGKVCNVKKSTLVWMLTSGRFKCSNDRVSRFQQPKKHAEDEKSDNQTRAEISCGDWIVFDDSVICHVGGFQYITGKNSFEKRNTIKVIK